MTRPSNLPPGCTDTDIERDAGQADTCADFPSRDEFHHINDLAARIAPGIVWDIGRHGIWSNDEVARASVALAIAIYRESSRQILGE